MHREEFEIYNNYPTTHKATQDTVTKNGCELIYLDSSSTSLTPNIVVDSMSDYYKHSKSNTDRGLYKTEINSTKLYNDSRNKVADFLNVNNDEIIFTSGSTQSSNDLIRIFEKYYLQNKNRLVNKNKILISKYAHNSDLLPIQEFSISNNLKLIICDNLEDFYDNLKDDVLIVSHTLVSNVTGGIFDLRDLFAKCSDLSIFTICDLTSGVGKIDINLKDLGMSAAYFSAHKMYGPSGVGVTYINKSWLLRFSPVNYGGGMVSDVSEDKSYYRSDIKAYEAGSHNVAGALGLSVAIDYINNIGIENIRTHQEELTKYLIIKLLQIDSLTPLRSRIQMSSEGQVTEKQSYNVGIVSFVINGIHSHDVAEYLACKHICIRSGHMCAPILLKSFGVSNVCRVSFGIYNNKEDIDELVLALRECVDKFTNS